LTLALAALFAGATVPAIAPAAAETTRANPAAKSDTPATTPDVQLVASIDGAVRTLTREEAKQLFLGHRNRLNDGTPVTLIDLPSGQTRNQLYQQLTGKNPIQVRANWSRLVFSGRVRPPREAGSESEALEWLASTPNAIGYLPADVSDKRLKVLLVVGG
jgi:hypothetical protein